MAVTCLTLALAGSAGAQLGQGYVLFEFWDGIGGGTTIPDLTNNAGYPDNPTSSTWINKFQSPSGRADNYGVRGRAFITPPETGDYTFWVAGDDQCQLWLSSDDSPANAVMICQVASWTGVAEWGKEAGQKSAPVALVAGQKYYLEGLMKEGGGGDSLDVGWAGPGIGDAATVIAGQYCTAFVRDPEPLLKAQSPKPANGAIDVTSPQFEWTAGVTAVNHDIYFGTSAELGDADFKMSMPVGMYYHIDPLVSGATYYWRVDEVDAAGAKIVGDVWSFTAMPNEAHVPVPADAAEDVAMNATLQWKAGLNAIGHMVFLSKDQAAVAAGDISALATSGADPAFTPVAPLDPFSTYYWRVDEISSTGTMAAGPIWSFKTVKYLPLFTGPVSFDYDNTAEPFLSATDVPAPADLTYGGKAADLVVSFQGLAPIVALDEATGTYAVRGAGADIWNNADEFTYAYKTLNGDGAMVARVVNIGPGSNTWAKGGVMIRQSLEAGSTHAYMPLTSQDGNGASFQRRPVADAASANNDAPSRISAPYFVKIERVGNAFSGYLSPDGETWTQLGGAIDIPMTDPVLIGLAVTSHAAGESRTIWFDSVSTTGDVAEGSFTTYQTIGNTMAANSAESIFVALEDAAGNMAMVAHPDPAATQIGSTEAWRVPFADFTGVDPTNVKRMQLGVGNGEPGGTGTMTLIDVRTVPSEKPTVVWVSFHGADDAPSGGAAGAGFTEAADKAYTDLLKTAGYNVVRYVQTGTPNLSVINEADLVIVSRSVASGSFQNAAASTWNSVTAPMIILNGYVARKSRMGYNTGSTIPDITGDITLTVTDPMHPIFAGVPLTILGGAMEATMVNPYAGRVSYANGTLARGISVVTEPVDDEATVLAVISDAGNGPAGAAIIAEYPAGATLTHDGGAGNDVLGGPRLLFLTGGREADGINSETAGMYDLYDDGAMMFLNAVEYMLQ
jgi:hypothetical protein